MSEKTDEKRPTPGELAVQWVEDEKAEKETRYLTPREQETMGGCSSHRHTLKLTDK